MLRHLKALWHLPETLNRMTEATESTDTNVANMRWLLDAKLPNGLGLTEQDRLMIREVHNFVTEKLKDYLKTESDRIADEAIAEIMARRDIIQTKGERLTPSDFSAESIRLSRKVPDDDPPF